MYNVGHGITLCLHNWQSNITNTELCDCIQNVKKHCFNKIYIIPVCYYFIYYLPNGWPTYYSTKRFDLWPVFMITKYIIMFYSEYRFSPSYKHFMLVNYRAPLPSVSLLRLTSAPPGGASHSRCNLGMAPWCGATGVGRAIAWSDLM